MSNLVAITRDNAIAYIGKPVRVRKKFTEDDIFSTLRAFDSAGFLIDTSEGAGFYSAEEYGIKAVEVVPKVSYIQRRLGLIEESK